MKAMTPQYMKEIIDTQMHGSLAKYVAKRLSLFAVEQYGAGLWCYEGDANKALKYAMNKVEEKALKIIADIDIGAMSFEAHDYINSCTE